MNYFSKVFKYELRRRATMISLFVGVMCGLTIIATLLVLPFKLDVLEGFTTSTIFMVFSQIAIMGIPFVMFFYCGAGFITSILYRNSNYLLLTLPVPSELLLSGHMLAGLVEFLIYLLTGGVLQFWNMFFFMRKDNDLTSFSDVMQLLIINITANWGAILFFMLSTLIMFFFIGTLIMAIAIFIRCFIRKKRNTASVISFFSALYLLFKLIGFLENFTTMWVWEIKLTFYNTLAGSHPYLPKTSTIDISLIPILCFVLLSVIFFMAGNWLLKKKIEV